MNLPKVFMLTIPKNLLTKTTQTSILSWEKKGFEVHLVYGIERCSETSKIVMDSWKRFFTTEFVNNHPNGIILAEDDSYLLKNWSELIYAFKKKNINWFGFQSTFKENNKLIPVGVQAFYIPNEQLDSYIQQILTAKSIHFDRFNSRVKLVYYPFKAKEAVLELERISLTTGRLRKGYKVD